MKKLFLITILLVSLTAQGQEYFSKEYNKAIIVYDDKEINVPIKVEFNVFRTTDILVRMGDDEPIRYIQVGDVVDPRSDGLGITFQYLKVKLAGTGHIFTFALYDDGDLVIVNEQNDSKTLFTNSQ